MLDFSPESLDVLSTEVWLRPIVSLLPGTFFGHDRISVHSKLGGNGIENEERPARKSYIATKGTSVKDEHYKNKRKGFYARNFLIGQNFRLDFCC